VGILGGFMEEPKFKTYKDKQLYYAERSKMGYIRQTGGNPYVTKETLIKRIIDKKRAGKISPEKAHLLLTELGVK
jgi:hypothetical protein